MNAIKGLTLMLALLFSQSAYSKKLYINPRLGAGTSGLYSSTLGSSSPIVAGMATTGAIFAGYSFSNFRVGIGLSVLNTRYTFKDLLFEEQYDPLTGLPIGWNDEGDLTYRHTQLIIPVTASYVFMPRKKVSVAPELSLGPGFNIASRSELVSHKTGKVTKGKSAGGPIAIYGQMSIHFIYNLNSRLGIAFTPTYAHEVNNVFSGNRVTTARPPGLYALTGSVGVMLKL